MAIYVGLILLFYSHTRIHHLYSSAPGSYVRYEKARVVAVERESLTKDSATGLDVGGQTVKIKVLTGEHKGEVMSVRNTLNYTTNVRARVGAGVIVCIDTANKNTYDAWIYSYNREPYLYLLVLFFFAILCAIGGSRGARSVLGIVFTFTGIIFLFIPMLYRGYSPAFASMGVVTVTLCVTLVLLGGFTAKTFSAILGTMSGVVVSVLFLMAALKITRLSGFSTNEADMLIQIAGKTHMKAGELLFAAILISSLGAIMDIAISIAASVHEVFASNSALRVKDLFNSGMNVGRDMMGTVHVLQLADDVLAKALGQELEREAGECIAFRQRTAELDHELLSAYAFEGMIGESLMLDVFAKIRRVAPHFKTTLVSGATGTVRNSWRGPCTD